MNKTAKTSNLLACYQEVASGEPLEDLYSKYVKADVIVSLELFNKGVTFKQFNEFIQRRDAHIEAMLNTPPKKVVVFSKGLKRKC